MSQIDATDARLDTHLEVCAARYQNLDSRMGNLEKRFDRIEQDLRDMKESNSKALQEIKSLITAGKDEKFKTMIGVCGTIILGMMTLMGYLVTHLG